MATTTELAMAQMAAMYKRKPFIMPTKKQVEAEDARVKQLNEEVKRLNEDGSQLEQPTCN